MKVPPITETSSRILAMNLDRVSAQKTKEFIEKYSSKNALRRNVYTLDLSKRVDDKVLESIRGQGVVLYQRHIERPINRDYCFFLRSGNYLIFTKVNDRPTIEEPTLIPVSQQYGDIYVKGLVSARESNYHFNVEDVRKKGMLNPLPRKSQKLFHSTYDLIRFKDKDIEIDGLESYIQNL